MYELKKRLKEKTKEKFAERLKKLREERELSIAQLAKATGLNQVTIKEWENKKHIVNLKALIVFAAFFKVTLGYLLGTED